MRGLPCHALRARCFARVLARQARASAHFSRRASMRNLARKAHDYARRASSLACEPLWGMRSLKRPCTPSSERCAQSSRSLRTNLFALRPKLNASCARLFALHAEPKAGRTGIGARRQAHHTLRAASGSPQATSGVTQGCGGSRRGALLVPSSAAARWACAQRMLRSSDWPQLFERSGEAA